MWLTWVQFLAPQVVPRARPGAPLSAKPGIPAEWPPNQQERIWTYIDRLTTDMDRDRHRNGHR